LNDLKTREELVIGSLFHDIGKVVRRAGLSIEAHQRAGLEFFKKEFSNLLPDIGEFIEKHHEGDSNSPSVENANNKLVYYTCYADNISSSERMTKIDKGFDEIRNIDNIFCNLFVEEKEPKKESSFFKPMKLSENISATNEQRASKENYVEILKSFVDDLKNSSLTVNDIDFVFMKHFSFIPSQTAKEGVMDVSLYDHSKTTAMLALALYDYTQGTIQNYRDLKSLKDEKTFLLVGGDVSGVQNFINRTSSEGALRSFRGRSFFIELMQEVIVQEILDRTNFFRPNVHFVGGGHFYIVLSNTEYVKNVLEEIKKEINEWFFKKGLEMRILIDYVPFTPDDVKNMSVVFEKLSEKVNSRKLKPYSKEELESLFELNYDCELQTCKVCGSKVNVLFRLRDMPDEEPIACEMCRQFYIIGREILESKRAYIVETDERTDMNTIDVLGKRYCFSDKPGKGFKIHNIYDFSKDEDEIVRLRVITYAKHSEIEKVGEEAPGKKIAAFKADVDGLGNIFKNGFKEKTLSRLSTLSRMLTYFFKQKLRFLLEKGDVKRNIVVIYSGGDDLFLIGGWNDVLDFAKDLRYEFNRFVSNELVTFSAGYVLTDEKASIYEIMKLSDEVEDLAKSNKYGEKEKNSIAFSNALHRSGKSLEKGIAINWDEFLNDFWAVYSKVKNYAEAPNTDRALIRKILTMSVEPSPMDKAFIAYMIGRKGKGEEDEEGKDPEKDFLKFLLSKGGTKLKALNTIMQFADLLFRKKREV